MARVAIQILLFKSSPHLSFVLEKLKLQTFKDWELFVVENSVDAEEARRVTSILQASNIPYHLAINQTNVGFSVGHNQLFLQSNAEFVLVLNDDAFLEPGYIEACVKRFDEESQAASVTGLIYRWVGASPETMTADAQWTIDTAGLEFCGLGAVTDRCSGQVRAACSDRLVSQSVFGVSATAALYRRRHILSVAPDGLLFDPEFFMYKGDVELAIRLSQKGYTSWLEDQAVAFHRRSFKEERRGVIARTRAEWRRPRHLRSDVYLNQWRLYIYYFPFGGWFGFGWTLWWELLRTGAMACLSPLLFLQTCGQILKDLPRAFRRRREIRERLL